MTRSRSSAHRTSTAALRRAVLGVALLLAALLLGGCDADGAEVEALEGSFYLEARVEVSPSGPDLNRGDLLPTVTEVRFWFLDARRQRQELTRLDAFFEREPYTISSDGEYGTSYDPASGTYQRSPLPEDDPPLAMMASFSAMVGRFPADSADGFVEAWGEHYESVDRLGTDEVLGRTVEVFEFAPMWRESSTDSDGNRVDDSGGVNRVYLDPETMLILRHEARGNEGRGQSFTAEVTHLDLDPSFESDTFSVRLPSDAVDQTEAGSSCSMGGSGGTGMWHFSSGYLRPTYDPEGWQLTGSGSSSGDGCASIEEWGELEHPEGGRIILLQRPVPPGGVPPVHDGLERVDLGGVEGYRVTSEGVGGEVTQLLWVQDGVIARLQTDTAPFEELVRIAESVEVVP